MKKILNSIWLNVKFYLFLDFYFTGRAMSKALRSYLSQDGKVVISRLFTNKIVIKNYLVSAISHCDEISNYFNSCNQEYFTVDDIIIKPSKLIFKKSSLPEVYEPKNLKYDNRLILLGCDKNSHPVYLNTKTSSGLFIGMGSGSGKSYFLKSVLRNMQNRKYQGYDIQIWDPKDENEFGELKEENVSIIKTPEEALDRFKILDEQISKNNNHPTLIVLEEYLIWTSTSSKNKEAKQLCSELIEYITKSLRLWRSKGIFLIITTQSTLFTEQEIDLNLVGNKLFSSVSLAASTNLGISKIFVNRSDLKQGKFIISTGGTFQLMRAIK